MAPSVGRTSGDEPYHSRIGDNASSETIGPQDTKLPTRNPPASVAETPNGATSASDVITALTEGPIGAKAAKAAPNGAQRAPSPRTVNDTVIPKAVKPGKID